MSRPAHSRPLLKPVLIIGLFALVAIIGLVRFHHAAAPAKAGPPKQSAGQASAPQPASHHDTQLQQILDTWASQHTFHASIVATELTGQQRTANENSGTSMVTASTYKIFVAYAALHDVEQGRVSLTTRTRTGQTVQQALDKMILQSDNASAEALGFLIGWDRINSLAAEAGATHTDINNYDSAGQPVNGDKHSTAADLALLVTKLQKGTLLNAANTELLLGLMEKQVWRERVPAGVPSGITVADKPGWLSDVENDAAIVYGPKSTYVLVIMTDGSTTQPLARLSQQIYNYLES